MLTFVKICNYNRVCKEGKMKNNWSKTLLYVYKYLDRVCEGIDALVEESALNSFYYRNDNEVNRVTKRICELCERKAKLINIRVLVDNCLLKIERQNAQLLIQKYIDDEISEVIAERNNMNVRTYFRKLIQAEKSFTILLLQEGFSSEKLQEYLSNEKWIIEIYQKFEKESKEENID